MEYTKPNPRSNRAAQAKTTADELMAIVKAPQFRPNLKAQAALNELAVPGGKRPKLVITGRSTMAGRGATLMRIRPSIWKRLEQVETVGTRQYLVVEAALTMFISHLEGLPPGETLILDAEKMSATPEDHELLEASGAKVKPPVARKRVAKRSFVDLEENTRPQSR